MHSYMLNDDKSRGMQRGAAYHHAEIHTQVQRWTLRVECWTFTSSRKRAQASQSNLVFLPARVTWAIGA